MANNWKSLASQARKLLADDIRNAWKWATVQLGFWQAVITTLYANIDALQGLIPPKPFAIVQVILSVLVMGAAVLKKGKR